MAVSPSDASTATSPETGATPQSAAGPNNAAELEPSAFATLWRRIHHHKVVHWVLVYAAAAYTLLHGVEMISGALSWPHVIVRVLTLVLILGAPITALLAWYHGHKAQHRISGPELAMLSVLLFIAGTLLWTLSGSNAEHAENAVTTTAATETATNSPVVPVSPRTAVAVLPFANLTGDASKDYLGDGMAEELINTLAKVQGLKVPARTSTFAYKGRNTDIRQIAKDLGVGTILEGSVRAAGKRIRITAQLIDARDGLHLWSESYDEEFTDIFKLQDKLATQIAKALQINLGGDAGDTITHTVGTTDVEAYNLDLQGRSLVEGGSAEQMKHALELYEQAVRLDPRYARAWSGMGRVHFGLATLLRSDVERMESERTTRQALALDPGDSLAQTILGQLISTTRDFVEAEGHYRAALESAPADSFSHSVYVSQLARVGHLRQALLEARKGYALAPASAYAMGRLAQALSLTGSEAEASKWAAIARTMYGSEGLGFLSFRSVEFRVALHERRLEAATDALVIIAAPAEIDRTSLDLIVAAKVDPTKRPAAVAIMSSFYPKASAPKPGTGVSFQWYLDSTPACTAAYLYAVAGALDEAYNLANRCLPAPIGLGLSVGDLWAPETAAFRRDPRFADYIERLGLHLIEYWQKYGPPDDCDLKDSKLICH